MFVLGAVVGGILVAYTPLGGSPLTSSATSSPDSPGSEGDHIKDSTNSPFLSPTTSPTFEALADKEAQKDDKDQGVYKEDDQTPDVLHNNFDEVLPNEQKNMEESEPTPDVEDEEAAAPPNHLEGDTTEKNIYPIDQNADTMTTAPQTNGSIPYTGDDNEDDDDDLIYVPGDLSQLKKGLLLSRGLDVAIIAQSNRPVLFANGTLSKTNFHGNPDFGATFAYPDDDESNPGGYVYVSNSEIKRGGGGVGAL